MASAGRRPLSSGGTPARRRSGFSGATWCPQWPTASSAAVWWGSPVATRLVLAPTGGVAPKLIKRPEFWFMLLAVALLGYGFWAFASDWKLALGSLAALAGLALALVALKRLVKALWPDRAKE